ncbi:isopentenyl-diphosphate delta-isomerase idi1 [Porites harrisoni]
MEIDSSQAKFLEEPLIMVDEADAVKGYETKRDCHLKANIIEHGMLHRAFSVFLFNGKRELLMQQRSDKKITFPGYITNTCCSHPLHNDEEMEEYGNIGVRKAAKRRLSYELGIPDDEISVDDLRFLTRIHYRAGSDKIWGEHEMDYVLFMQKEVTLQPNVNEVKDCWYASQTQIKELLQKSSEDPNTLVTPWFKLIADHFLFKWWASLNDLSHFENDREIHRMPGIPT